MLLHQHFSRNIYLTLGQLLNKELSLGLLLSFNIEMCLLSKDIEGV